MWPFKSFTLAWWQFSLLKLSMLALGILVGSSWPEVFAAWRWPLATAFLAPALYLSGVALRQR